MTPCEGVYYGREQIWKCKLPAGHEGAHKADKYNFGTDKSMYSDTTTNLDVTINYCQWDDDDMMYSFIWWLEAGGDK